MVKAFLEDLTIVDWQKVVKNQGWQPGEMARKLRAHAPFANYLDLVPRTHMMVYNCLKPQSQGIQDPLLHTCMWYTCIHVGKILIHIKTEKCFKGTKYNILWYTMGQCPGTRK